MPIDQAEREAQAEAHLDKLRQSTDVETAIATTVLFSQSTTNLTAGEVKALVLEIMETLTRLKLL